MHYHWWNVVLILATVIGQAILSFTAGRRWPFLITYCVFGIARSATLACESRYATYFYTYWIAELIAAVLQFGVLYDVLRSIPGAVHLPKRVGVPFFAASLTVSFLVVKLTTTTATTPSELVNSALLMAAAAQTAWYTFALTALGCVSFIGFAWPRLPLQVVSWFVFLGISSMLTSNALLHWPHFRTSIGVIASLSQLLVLFSWIAVFTRANRAAIPIEKSVIS